MSEGPRFDARRSLPPGVVPQEIWDLPLACGALLHERVGAPRIDALRARGEAEDAIDRAIARDLVEGLLRIREGRTSYARASKGFDAIHVSGGLSARPGLRAAVYALAPPFAIAWSDDGRHTAERGGIALLRALGLDGGVVVDVGQTAVKVSVVAGAGTRRTVRERDLASLPAMDSKGAAALSRARRDDLADRARGFVAEAISDAIASAPAPPEGIVLALPADFDAEGIPGPCLYPGWGGDARLAHRILDRLAARFADDPRLASHAWRGATVPAPFLNDAELAAVSAGDDLRRLAIRYRRAFVVTLGTGPGGALLISDRDPASAP